MNVDFTKPFNKQFEKLPENKQKQAKTAIGVFLIAPATPYLRNHALKVEWLGYCSISAGGDFRLHFKIISQNTVLFVALGSHSQLYK